MRRIRRLLARKRGGKSIEEYYTEGLYYVENDNIDDALKCLEQIKGHPEYQQKINALEQKISSKADQIYQLGLFYVGEHNIDNALTCLSKINNYPKAVVNIGSLRSAIYSNAKQIYSNEGDKKIKISAIAFATLFTDKLPKSEKYINAFRQFVKNLSTLRISYDVFYLEPSEYQQIFTNIASFPEKFKGNMSADILKIIFQEYAKYNFSREKIIKNSEKIIADLEKKISCLNSPKEQLGNIMEQIGADLSTGKGLAAIVMDLVETFDFEIFDLANQSEYSIFDGINQIAQTVESTYKEAAIGNITYLRNIFRSNFYIDDLAELKEMLKSDDISSYESVENLKRLLYHSNIIGDPVVGVKCLKLAFEPMVKSLISERITVYQEIEKIIQDFEPDQIEGFFNNEDIESDLQSKMTDLINLANDYGVNGIDVKDRFNKLLGSQATKTEGFVSTSSSRGGSQLVLQ